MKISDAKTVIWTVALMLAGLNQVVSAGVIVPSFVEIGGTGMERGLARLVCEQRNSNLSIRVRAIVLDIGTFTPGHEVLLAPAHVLPEDNGRIKKDCQILGTRGQSARIAEFWLPETRNTELGTDWVVVVTRSALQGSVGRLRVGALSQTVLEQLLVDGTPVEVMAFVSRADQHNCRILELLESWVFMHTCRGRTGFSGAPILIGINGEPVVIGVQIAQMMRPINIEAPLFLGVGLAIDDAMAEAIQQAAAHVQGK